MLNNVEKEALNKASFNNMHSRKAQWQIGMPPASGSEGPRFKP